MSYHKVRISDEVYSITILLSSLMVCVASLISSSTSDILMPQRQTGTLTFYNHGPAALFEFIIEGLPASSLLTPRAFQPSRNRVLRPLIVESIYVSQFYFFRLRAISHILVLLRLLLKCISPFYKMEKPRLPQCWLKFFVYFAMSRITP